MSARVLPFTSQTPRRFGFVASPPQKDLFRAHVDNLQVLMTERPHAFAHVIEQTQVLADAIRVKLAGTL